MSWSSWKKEEAIFRTVYFVLRKFFNICILPQCIMYWIQNIHTLTYLKTLLRTILCFFLKLLKVFIVSLRSFSIFLAWFLLIYLKNSLYLKQKIILVNHAAIIVASSISFIGQKIVHFFHFSQLFFVLFLINPTGEYECQLFSKRWSKWNQICY